MNLLVKGGRVIDPKTGLNGVLDIRISSGKIAEIGESLAPNGDPVVDASGLLVAPGFIDCHTHLRDPGRPDEETIESGCEAAARGGYTAIMAMANTDPVADSAAVVEYIKARAASHGKIKVYPVGAVTKGLAGQEISEMGELKEASVVAFSDDGHPVTRTGVMRRALEYSKLFGLPVIVHCEDKELTEDGEMNEGYYSTSFGLRGMPAIAEELMVWRDIVLAEYTGARLHIAHVSTAGSLEIIRSAKSRGLKITCEATPHHLVLSDSELRSYDTNLKMNPPLRSQRDVEALRAGLVDGTIDCIATDHAPHTAEEKAVEFSYAPFGVTGLETAFPALFTELVQKGTLTLERLVEALTIGPARAFELPGGAIEPGMPGDITLVDLKLEKTVEAEEFRSLSKNSPFLGRRFSGWPVLTIAGGKVAYIDPAVRGRLSGGAESV